MSEDDKLMTPTEAADCRFGVHVASSAEVFVLILHTMARMQVEA
jgi:hypothetical protein